MKLIVCALVVALQCHLSFQFEKCEIRTDVGKAKRSILVNEVMLADREAIDVLGIKLNKPTVELVTMRVAMAFAGMVPVAGPFLAGFVNIFWPRADKPSVWDQVKEQVKEVVNGRFDAHYDNFWKGIEREFKYINSLGDAADMNDMKLTRMHALDSSLRQHEEVMKKKAADNPLANLFDFMTFASLRLALLSDMTCTEDNTVTRTKMLETYVHTLGEYAAYLTLEVEHARSWRKGKLSGCETYFKWFGSFQCKRKDHVKGVWYDVRRSSKAVCRTWCDNLGEDLHNELLKTLKPMLDIVPYWVIAYKRGLEALQKVQGGTVDSSCPTLGNQYDYTGTLAVAKSGRPCKPWTKTYGADEIEKYFPFDGDKGVTPDPKNYCRNPANWYWRTQKAVPHCYTDDAGKRREDCEVQTKCPGFNNAYFNETLRKRLLKLLEEM